MEGEELNRSGKKAKDKAEDGWYDEGDRPTMPKHAERPHTEGQEMPSEEREDAECRDAKATCGDDRATCGDANKKDANKKDARQNNAKERAAKEKPDAECRGAKGTDKQDEESPTDFDIDESTG